MFKHLVIGVLASVLFAAFYPTEDFDPLPIQNFAPPLVVEHNNELHKAELVLGVNGPEHVTWDSDGNLYSGLSNGTILRINKKGEISAFAHAGNPLSVKFDKKGNLIVCDAQMGLLSIDKKGRVCVLSNTATHKGVTRKIGFADFHDFSKDGKIYFSDASSKYHVHNYVYDMMEGRPHGSLLVYDPETEETKYLIKDEIYFANGVVVAPSGDFLLLCETFGFKIFKYWIKGPKAGTYEPLIQGLPGFPDNISLSPRGTLWVAFPSLRQPLNEVLFQYPAFARLLYRIPTRFHPKPKGTAVAEIDIEKGTIIRMFSDTTGAQVNVATTAVEHDGYLYISSLEKNIHRYKL